MANSPELAAPNQHIWATVTAWVVTAIAAALVVALRPPAQVPEWLTLALAGAVVVAFALQLVVAERIGFVARLTASVCGSLVIVLIGALVSALVAGVR